MSEVQVTVPWYWPSPFPAVAWQTVPGKLYCVRGFPQWKLCNAIHFGISTRSFTNSVKFNTNWEVARATNTFFWHYPLNWCGFWYWKCVPCCCRTRSFVKWRSVVWYTVIKTCKERAPAILPFRIRKVFGRREHQFVLKKFQCRILQHNFSRSRITERGRRVSLQ